MSTRRQFVLSRRSSRLSRSPTTTANPLPAKIAKIIRSTIIWLEMVQMLPPDIDVMVVDILETCTVPDFQLFFKTLCANASLNGIKLSVEVMLTKAEEHYRFLILSKRPMGCSRPSRIYLQRQSYQRSTRWCAYRSPPSHSATSLALHSPSCWRTPSENFRRARIQMVRSL